MALNSPNRITVRVTDESVMPNETTEYISLREAATALNTSHNALSNCLKNGHLFRGRYRIEALNK